MLDEKEKKLLRASPLPLLYGGFKYGMSSFISSVIYLKRNKVSFFKYYRINKAHLNRIIG